MVQFVILLKKLEFLFSDVDFVLFCFVVCSNSMIIKHFLLVLYKQKRLPFTSSTHVTISNFELIHVDIWDICSTPSLNGSRYFLTIVDVLGCF